MATLGQELKRRREEKGISIQQIAAKTLIGIRFLQAIETDDYGTLPGGVFNRAFVRKFAAMVGMDEAAALQLYEEQVNLQGLDTSPVYEMGVENWDPPQTTGNGLLISLGVLILLSVGAWFAYNYLYTAKAPSTEVTPERESSSPTNSAPIAGLEVTPSPSPTPMAEEKPPEGLQLRIETVSASCWMRIVRDAEPAEESTQLPGSTIEFTAREKMVVSLGNLPSLRVTINGRTLNPAKVLKSPRNVVLSNLILTRENYLNYVD